MRNREKLILVGVIIISIASTFISYRTYISFVQARTFTTHFNTRSFEVDKDFFDALITDFPNLSATTIPIKAIKGLYLSAKKDPSIEDVKKAKHFLWAAIKDNPFIKVPEAELSKIYFLEQNIDSAIHYGKIAFEGIKKNPIHFAHYAAALAADGDTATIKNIYENLGHKNFLIDKIFLTAMTEVIDQDKSRKITQAVEYLSVNDDQYKTNIYILNHGRENVLKAMDLNKKAESFFLENNFQKAAQTYIEAISKNPSEPAFYENAGNSYLKMGDHKNAQIYLQKAIDSFNTKTGKPEYLYGLSKMQEGNMNLGCNFLAISYNTYKYNLSLKVYQKFCK